jgi:SAM-dependent methyltransferase
MSAAYGPIKGCQTCGAMALKPVLFLAFLPPVNVMRPVHVPHKEETWLPAELLWCPECTLTQLGYIADPSLVFPPDYPYTSGTTKILRENFANLYVNVQSLMHLTSASFVIDIGSNDGTLLKNFVDGGHRVLGIEPSLAAKLAEEKGVKTMMTFFGTDATDRVLKEYEKADIITAANVFAHILDPNSVTANIVRLLKDDGIFVSESHYLLDLIRGLQYDTIYHEHLRYYSLHSIRYLLERNGCTIFNVERIPTHGGSIRVYSQKGTRFPIDPSVASLLKEEEDAGLTRDTWISDFRRRVTRSKIALHELLAPLVRDGKNIHGIGAPSRASTLVNYVGFGSDMLSAVLEIAGSKKIGFFMPGTDIPVDDEKRLYDEQPDYALLLSWHIADELMPNLKKRGFKGDFIIPLPEPRIVRSSDV